MDEVTQRLGEFGGPMAVSVMNHVLSLLGALAVLIIGLSLAKWADHAVRRTLLRQGYIDRTLGLLLANLARYGIVLVTLLATLAQFGVETTSFLAVLGAAGLAIGLALQGTLQNVAAGVMLLMIRPFRVGEQIEVCAGAAVIAAGQVVELSLFTTEIRTPDDIYMLIPNAQLWGAAIRNPSRPYSGSEQTSLNLALPLGTDATAALNLIRQTARDTVGIEPDSVSVQITGIEGLLRLTVSVKAATGTRAAVRTALSTRLLAALTGAGMTPA